MHDSWNCWREFYKKLQYMVRFLSHNSTSNFQDKLYTATYINRVSVAKTIAGLSLHLYLRRKYFSVAVTEKNPIRDTNECNWFWRETHDNKRKRFFSVAVTKKNWQNDWNSHKYKRKKVFFVAITKKNWQHDWTVTNTNKLHRHRQIGLSVVLIPGLLSIYIPCVFGQRMNR